MPAIEPATPQAPTSAAPAPSFSKVRRAHGLVFVSSEVAHQPSGRAPAGVGAQTDLILQHLRSTLAAHHLSMADIVQVTAHLRRAEDFAPFSAVYQQFFAAPYPARTTVIAESLYPGALVELTVVAAEPG